MDKQTYRVKEFCQCYTISKASFYREITAGRLKIIKRGRTTLITKSEAERWLQYLCQTSPHSPVSNHN